MAPVVNEQIVARHLGIGGLVIPQLLPGRVVDEQIGGVENPGHEPVEHEPPIHHVIPQLLPGRVVDEQIGGLEDPGHEPIEDEPPIHHVIPQLLPGRVVDDQDAMIDDRVDVVNDLLGKE